MEIVITFSVIQIFDRLDVRILQLIVKVNILDLYGDDLIYQIEPVTISSRF